ncbi:hypothetical protein KBB49_02180 [Candidatus Saccharibacteria bacterium]|nr:hypothetical protein [Candidatus Saccharibacteria bacterium]
MNVPETETPSIFEILEANNQYCATCLEMGRCVIIEGLMNLYKWNDDNPVAEERDGDEETTLTRKQQDAFLIRPPVAELFVDLVGVQTECVASMQANEGSLQETAVSVIAGSVAGSLAQRDRRV